MPRIWWDKYALERIAVRPRRRRTPCGPWSELPDELVRLIASKLRYGNQPTRQVGRDLGSMSAACRGWRRAIADDPAHWKFIDRYRGLYEGKYERVNGQMDVMGSMPPPFVAALLEDLMSMGVHPTQPPTGGAEVTIKLGTLRKARRCMLLRSRRPIQAFSLQPLSAMCALKVWQFLYSKLREHCRKWLRHPPACPHCAKLLRVLSGQVCLVVTWDPDASHSRVVLRNIVLRVKMVVDTGHGGDALLFLSDKHKVQLRFKVGDKVLCTMKGAKSAPGTIVALWYRDARFAPGKCAPYQIRLNTGKLIYAPVDEDNTIRADPAP